MEANATARVSIDFSSSSKALDSSPASSQSKSAGSTRELSPSTVLFYQGSSANEVFCIEKGLIKLIRMNEDGEELVIGLRSKGSLLGAASVIVQELHPITAITVTSCTLSRIPADLFLRMVKRDEQFCWRLHQVHSLEVHEQAAQLEALRCLSARQRLERLILQFLTSIFPQNKQASRKIRLPLKHWEIAQLIGVTPEHLSRVFKQIKQEGILHEEDGCMVISDIYRLTNQ
jgi:CRP-like cAMP-binding protein